MPRRLGAFVVGIALLASACSDAAFAATDAEVVDVSSTISDHSAQVSCDGGFVAHDLDHITAGPGSGADTFTGTGAGVGVGDLDDDGDLDIVLANLFEGSSILENDGDLTFSRHDLGLGRFRGVALIDANQDGTTDIVMTTGAGQPVLYANPGDGDLDGFEREDIGRNVRAVTYSMAWTDIGGDGDLDLITGSYNAEVTARRNSPIVGEDTGVVLYTRNDDGGFDVDRLSPTAQALALITTDLDDDGRPDVIVGNDLLTPDMVWSDVDGALVPTDLPFSTTSYSTMSLDAADIDNDGLNELFSTDMRPTEADDPRYREVNRDLEAAPVVDDIQRPENVLNDPGPDGFNNLADSNPLAATGWSWSGLFGDLDNDGFQDLYVATGMRSDVLFDFLPEARLELENQAFATRDGSLVPAPEWDLAATEGGRGMSFADFDSDGDLDIVINNLDAPARLFENQLCGNSVTVDLDWTGTFNRPAYGATVRVSDGETTWSREIVSSRGYLSSAPPIAHIGIGQAESVDVQVVWPDGSVSTVDTVPARSHVRIAR